MDIFGVCFKNSKRRVLFQNSVCIEKCGNLVGQICAVACPGTTLKYEVADNQMLTLFHPPESTNDQRIEYYRKQNLTKSELKVVLLILEGLSNSQIAEKLFISKATVKTHINNIYKKIPFDMRPRN